MQSPNCRERSGNATRQIKVEPYRLKNRVGKVDKPRLNHDPECIPLNVINPLHRGAARSQTWHAPSALTSEPPTLLSPSSRVASPPSSLTLRVAVPLPRSWPSPSPARSSLVRSPSARRSPTLTAPSPRSSATWVLTGPSRSTTRSTPPRRSAPASWPSSRPTPRPTWVSPSPTPSSPSRPTSTTPSARPPRRPAPSRA